MGRRFSRIYIQAPEARDPLWRLQRSAKPYGYLYPDNSSSAADWPFSPEAEFLESFEKLLELGFADAFRALDPSTEGIYSRWGPKNKNRLYNRGSRLDYILVSNKLLGFTAGIKYHLNVLDSDHCPVTINISPPALYSEQTQEDLADKWRATD